MASSLKPIARVTSSSVLNEEIHEAKFESRFPSRLISIASLTARSACADKPMARGESLKVSSWTVKTPVLCCSSSSYVWTASSASSSLRPPTGIPAIVTFRATSSVDVARSAQ